jgi:hypothetical protein
MWILLGIQLLLIFMFYLMGWVLRNKKAYWLISGFATRPKEEQQQLIENGYPQKTGTLMKYTAIGMVILLPLCFSSFTYTVEVQFGFMLFFLLGGLIYLSKYEVQKKRKRSYIISTSFFIGMVSFVSVLMFLGYQDYQLLTKKNSFEITGIYGDQWLYEDIEKIELMDDLPQVTLRQNGFGLATMAKGVFRVKGYGSSLLFIKKDSSPYLYIELKNQKIFINSDDSNQTRGWYKELSQKQN